MLQLPLCMCVLHAFIKSQTIISMGVLDVLEGMFMEPFLCCQCSLETVPNEFRPLWKYFDWMLFSLYVIPAQIGY